MNVTYLNDDDLDFLQHCSEEQLANITRLLTHNEKGKARLSSVLSHNELFKSMEGHPEQHRRNWQLIAGELQHYGGDSIANKLRGHGKLYRAILLDVSKRLKIKADKEMSTFEIEQSLLEHFLRNAWQKMDAEHKQEFLQAVDAKVSELEELLPLLMKDRNLAKGVSHLLSGQLTRILRTHAAVSVIGHGLLRGAGLGGPVGAALNGVKAVSGSAYRVTIPAVLHIACLRRMLNHTQA
ncbi:TPA: acidic protein MsyB [Citrobacter youngae]|uniref:acidic protein MsyB n=1 Tax=Citrobacter TaxID=544 RepID=UPI00190208AC|nr:MULTISPECIES: acidic protein MsyB [Citrobacter]MBJ8741267.1 acidic protein MsyB [Citrobacter sp. FDAARGOS_156]MBJ9557364.1 acidic protein MsyB [Citrobacter sp. FDAARGOS_156]UUX53836.1 acidic protein MsyB [Citrobacter youngae]HDX4034455.1 acidic protein MsyB [Citrobacter youngae]HEE0141254.1 acidic protein MsyB [Citrobacter youngae]